MEAPQPTLISSPISLEFGCLANSLAQLLEVARREIERDREAAKASLATASSILQSEIERRSGARHSRTAGLAGWQVSRVRAFIDKALHSTIHTQDLSLVARRASLSDVVLSVGFSDQAHLCRFFRQAFGQSPAGWRREREIQ
jgi:AraC family transcriptional regulator